MVNLHVKRDAKANHTNGPRNIGLTRNRAEWVNVTFITAYNGVRCFMLMMGRTTESILWSRFDQPIHPIMYSTFSFAFY